MVTFHIYLKSHKQSKNILNSARGNIKGLKINLFPPYRNQSGLQGFKLLCTPWLRDKMEVGTTQHICYLSLTPFYSKTKMEARSTTVHIFQVAFARLPLKIRAVILEALSGKYIVTFMPNPSLNTLLCDGLFICSVLLCTTVFV